MNSNFVSMKPNYPPLRYSDELRRKINEQIDKQIEWYDLNGDRKEDHCIKIDLESIKKLAENIENSDDILYIEKIISIFCEIIETQRKVIDDLSVLGFDALSCYRASVTGYDTKKVVFRYINSG